MSLLTCEICGLEQDAGGPGVSAGENPYWIPFIEDLRGTPSRLVHPRCFVDENGLEALLVAVSAHDRRMRQAEFDRWRRTRQQDLTVSPEQVLAVREAFALANVTGALRTLPVESDAERIFIVSDDEMAVMGDAHSLEIVVSQLLARRVMVTGDVGAPTVLFP